MKPTYIIAGNFNEFAQWCREKMVSSSSPLVKYISENEGPQVLAGIKNPEIICFGTYNKRRDVRELENIVRERSQTEVRVVEKIIYREPPKKKVKYIGGYFRKVLWNAKSQ